MNHVLTLGTFGVVFFRLCISPDLEALEVPSVGVVAPLELLDDDLLLLPIVPALALPERGITMFSLRPLSILCRLYEELDTCDPVAMDKRITKQKKAKLIMLVFNTCHDVALNITINLLHFKVSNTVLIHQFLTTKKYRLISQTLNTITQHTSKSDKKETFG